MSLDLAAFDGKGWVKEMINTNIIRKKTNIKLNLSLVTAVIFAIIGVVFMKSTPFGATAPK
jgi:uncharacterized protein (UPF0333 family)